MNLSQKLIATAATFFLTANPIQAFTVTVEDPKIQSPQVTENVFTIDFNDLTVNSTGSFSKSNDIDSITYSYGGDLLVTNTDIYGGADNSYYLHEAEAKLGYNITVDQEQKYFGFWWSAGDGGNKIIFKRDGAIVRTFNTQNVIDTLAGLSNTEDYYCNPTPLFPNEVCHEPYVFINFFFENGETYDEIVIENNNEGSNFESDNHTFSVTPQPPRGKVVPTETVVFAD
ncbi:MAG TPA: hypothetical protein ACFCUY_11675 [Xenococcaceae cyanobacterium]